MTTPHTTERAVLATFAELFAYPRGDVASTVKRCLALLEPGHPSAPKLRTFLSWASRSSHGEIEEVYSATFDLQPSCAPYVGHQICPEPARRNLFLSALAAVYSGEGFRPQEELGDHLSEVLRFLAVARDPEARLSLIHEGLVPAVERMINSLAPASTPYRALLDALLASVNPPARKHRGAPPEARP
ncbi:MAG TPA: nitrate reductase [Myxococcales bacterium]|nr:nitrate reductase [Myxococcales bacterium]